MFGLAGATITVAPPEAVPFTDPRYDVFWAAAQSLEMPLALQSKLLRFVECGELQREGDNETVKVDVRIIAATHRNLEEAVENREFRADLCEKDSTFRRVDAFEEEEEHRDLPRIALSLMSQTLCPLFSALIAPQ